MYVYMYVCMYDSISLYFSENYKVFKQTLLKKFCSIFPKNRAVYETKLKSMVEPVRLQMTIRRMRITCWILKAADTQTEYLIFIVFLRQKWLRERASILCYMYIAYSVAL